MSEQIVTPQPTLRELLGAGTCDAVLDDPMLVGIIEAAPSPKAADDHIKSLGWSNDLARQVRDMVRLRQEVIKNPVGDTWKLLTTTTKRRAYTSYAFGGSTIDCWPDVEASTKFIFGPCSNLRHHELPFLLRELRFPCLCPGAEYTTIDGQGKAGGYHRTLEVRDLDDTVDFSHCSPLFTITKRNGKPPFDFELYGTSDVFSKFTSGRLEIYSRHVALKPKPPERPFPQFYKFVEISKGFHWSGPKEYERIAIFWRTDLGEECPRVYSRTASSMTFERVMRIGSDLELVLRLSYSYSHVARPVETKFFWYEGGQLPPITCQFQMGRPNPAADPNFCAFDNPELTQRFAEMLKLAHAIFGNLSFRRVPLERVAGISLLANPPEHLSDLLTSR